MDYPRWALALIASAALAKESKPIATQVGEAMQPAAEAYGNTMTRLASEFFAGSKGVMGEAARANLKSPRPTRTRSQSWGSTHLEGMHQSWECH